ncbi:MAG TPA: hypothetical protein VFE58_01355 [Tepidisphaeraceae bacterium]|jgi:hypothetical protein|nr:hypothetical protein [Tepidisphaeraceae bacterium]
MDITRIGIKLFLANPKVHVESVVQVFHAWIQQQALAGNLLIDVADYLHVPTGPGVVLIGHEANYAIDGGLPGVGLLYQRKRPMEEGDLKGRLAHAFREALSAAWLLEREEKLKWGFDLWQMQIRIADKLNAPNTAETFGRLKPEIEGFLKGMLGGVEFTLEQNGDERVAFEVMVRVKKLETVEMLLSRVQV